MFQDFRLDFHYSRRRLTAYVLDFNSYFILSVFYSKWMRFQSNFPNFRQYQTIFTLIFPRLRMTSVTKPISPKDCVVSSLFIFSSDNDRKGEVVELLTFWLDLENRIHTWSIQYIKTKRPPYCIIYTLCRYFLLQSRQIMIRNPYDFIEGIFGLESSYYSMIRTRCGWIL